MCGMSDQMITFDYYFGVWLIHMIICRTDYLSTTLQFTNLSAAEGQENCYYFAGKWKDMCTILHVIIVLCL